MARYLLFAGGDDEMGGGMEDFVKGFDSVIELKKFLKEEPQEYFKNWWHVADAEECRILLYDYQFMKEHRTIHCGYCGDILKVVSKSEKHNPDEHLIRCETCRAINERDAILLAQKPGDA